MFHRVRTRTESAQYKTDYRYTLDLYLPTCSSVIITNLKGEVRNFNYIVSMITKVNYCPIEASTNNSLAKTV